MKFFFYIQDFINETNYLHEVIFILRYDGLNMKKLELKNFNI